jgi:hypothetical protein
LKRSKPKQRAYSATALVPSVPLHPWPRRGLANDHVLWEAEWRRPIPRDSLLLRRVGKTDL